MNKIIAYLKKKLGNTRFKHVMGTRKVAIELARIHSVDTEKADLAALLHDMARWMTKKEMISYVSKYRVKVPDIKNVIKFNPSLLHGFVGADLARRVFKVKDKEVLEAIALHTIGAAKMCKLSKILYLADITSPDRRHKDVKLIRRLSKVNIDEALLAAKASKIYYVIKKRGWLHPEAVKAWNSLVPQ